MTNKLIKNIIFGVGILILSTLSVHAGFGVSPTDISYENLKPGATFTKRFTLSRSGDLEKMDVTIQPDLEGIDSWFTYNPGKTFTFEAGKSTKTFEITVNVPSDTPYDTYNGIIRLTAAPADQAVRGVSITQGVRLDAGLVVTETDISSLSILSIKALDSVQGEPLKLEIVGENQGNVDAYPTINAKIMDLQMNVLEEHDITDFGFIKPNETATLIAEFETNLPSGEYFIEVDVLLDGKSLRKERLVIQINNIPSDDVGDQTETTNLISSIGAFIKENRVYFFYLAIAIVIEVIVYIILQRVWEKKKGSKKSSKLLGLLLGSKKTTRATLSFALGFIVFVSLILYHSMSLKAEPTEDLVIAEQVQGVKDSKIVETPAAILRVFPPIKVPQYYVYTEPNTSSEVIYEAQEDEDFTVIDEVEDWYKVQLPDGSNGWLMKAVIKSKLTQGE